MEAEEQEFLVEVEKLMTSEVATTLWADNMDLFALTTFDKLVQLYRISYKAQRVFQVQQDKVIKGLAFSPDCQLLVYGLSDGSIKLLRTENGEQILSLEGAHLGEVETLTFTPYCSLESTAFMPFEKNSLESKLILNISPHKNCNRNAIVKINYFTELKKQFTLLLSSDRTKTLFLLNGFLPIAEISYLEIGFSSPKTLFSSYDGKIRTILGEEKGIQTEIWLLQCQGKVIEEWKEPLIKAGCLLGYISEVLSFVQVAYDAAELIVRDALRQYNQKINLIEDPNIENLSPCEELFRFLNCGTTSTAIVNFFTKEVYDTKILEKLDETLNGCFSKLHDLLLQSVQNSLERAALLLCRLKDLAQGQQGRRLGLKLENLESAQSKLIKLYTMGEVLLVESTQAKFDIRNLLVWLNKSTIKSSGQNQSQIENSKSYLNKYTVDFARLHSFLCEQSNFKLHNLLTFFSKTNQHHKIHIQKPDFNIFKAEPKASTTQEEQDTFNKFAAMLEVEDIVVPRPKPIEIEQSYRNFKIQMKELKQQWKILIKRPVQNVSSQLKEGWKKTIMGTVEQTELFSFQLKTVVKEGQLLAYFVQRLEDRDVLVQFNCHTGCRQQLVTIQNHILTIAIAENILVVLENKYTGKKLVAQLDNESFDGSEIKVGKRITRVEGELDINSSMRGLNSLVIDKNKLMIFD